MKEMCDGRPPKGTFDLFAVEGGTAAMCYIFDTLAQNGLLQRGDTVALFLPTFTPYIEICRLDRFSFRIVGIHASGTRPDGTHDWHYPDAELAKLANPKVRMAFLVNPSNPPSVALGAAEMKQIVGIVKRKNPDLMVVTDDVYGTFVPGFRSFMAEVPHNTICVYSFSKNFGCTGWRLGVIGVHRDNIFDRKIAALSAAWKKTLDKRYGAAVARAAQDQVHRPAGRRQPHGRAQSHRRTVAAAAGADVLLRADAPARPRTTRTRRCAWRSAIAAATSCGRG